MNIRTPAFLLLFFYASCVLQAQEKTLTAGFQLRPIIPFDLVKTTATSYKTLPSSQISFMAIPGISGGMLVRGGITNALSFETGINYTKNIYQIDITSRRQGEVFTERLRVVSYDLFGSILSFIKLGERFYMNTSLGISSDFFPSDLAIFAENYQIRGLRYSVAKLAALANLGYEYRTNQSGYFYLGASYHLPFTNVYKIRIEYTAGTAVDDMLMNLRGNYFTIDFRYFFYTPKEKA